MGPPCSPSCVTSPTGRTSSSDELSSPPPHYHPYCVLRGCPQDIRHKKSQGTSPHPQPRAFSLVDFLNLYDPSSCPSFSPRQNLSPPPNIIEPALPPIMMTPPLSPFRAPDSLPPTLWSPKDPVYPFFIASDSQSQAGTFQMVSPPGNRSTPMNNNTYMVFPLTQKPTLPFPENDNRSTVSPSTLRTETWMFHSSKGVMLHFPPFLLYEPLYPLLIDSSSLTLHFVILLLSYSSCFSLTHLHLCMTSPCTI